MWNVRRITEASTELLLRASGQGPLRTHSLFADGELLVPYSFLVDQSSNPMQLDVCSQCGSPDCKAGGWVTLRSLDGSIVLMPWFEHPEPDPSEVDRYAPPEPIKRRGAAMLRGEALAAARRILHVLPAPAALPPLETREAALCLQLEAPFELLGRRPSPVGFDTSRVLACNENDLDALFKEADELFRNFARHSEPVAARSPPGKLVTLYLDGNTSFSPFARMASGELALHLGTDLDVGPAAGAAA